MPIQCADCRSWNRDSATYCDACGKPLGAVPAPKARTPGVAAASAHARRKPARLKKVTGEVRNLQERQEAGPGGQSTSIRTFVVESYDAAGNRLRPVPVEMRGRSFRGVLSVGDQVEIAKPWREGQTLRVTRLRNMTTGGKVKVRRVDWILALILLLIAAAVLVAVITSGGA